MFNFLINESSIVIYFPFVQLKMNPPHVYPTRYKISFKLFKTSNPIIRQIVVNSDFFNVI